jgi:hypothetical protein
MIESILDGETAEASAEKAATQRQQTTPAAKTPRQINLLFSITLILNPVIGFALRSVSALWESYIVCAQSDGSVMDMRSTAED